MIQVKCLDFWRNVFDLKTVSGDIKYPLLTIVVQFLIILPFGTASVERDFSLVNLIKTKLRNSLIRCREFVPDNISDFIPCREMFELFNVNMHLNEFW